MKYLLLIIPFLCSCKTVEYLGAVSIGTYNEHIEETQKFYTEAMDNQGKIGEVTVELAQENLIEARTDDDEAKIERSIGAKVRAEIATKRANKLADTKFTKAETPSLDWGGIIQMFLSALGISVPGLGIATVMMGKKIGRLKNKGRKMAESTEKDDISNDRDFA